MTFGRLKPLSEILFLHITPMVIHIRVIIIKFKKHYINLKLSINSIIVLHIRRDVSVRHYQWHNYRCM